MAEINYLTGDATKPIQTPAYIAHICNNKGGWGAGFVLAISKNLGRGPEASYRLWSREENFRLGQIQIVTVDSTISVVNMIAQDGFGSKENNFKPLHLKALKMCLKQLYEATKNEKITVHMPRIGCGLAGGTWDEIEPLIKKYITVNTFVYDFPEPSPSPQQ